MNSVALNFEGTEQVTTRVELDRENNVMVYVNLMVSSNVIIKELSANLQTKIKEKIKTATDLDVKEVNITVKKKSCTKKKNSKRFKKIRNKFMRKGM